MAEFPVHGQTAEAVISRADEALYAAKRAGRNRIERAGPERTRVKEQASYRRSMRLRKIHPPRPSSSLIRIHSSTYE